MRRSPTIRPIRRKALSLPPALRLPSAISVATQNGA
jgi:hypothetical protein